MNMQCVCQFFPLSQSALTDCLRPFMRRISFFFLSSLLRSLALMRFSHKLLQLQAMQRTSIDFHSKWRRWKYVTIFVVEQAVKQPTGVRRRWRTDITTNFFYFIKIEIIAGGERGRIASRKTYCQFPWKYAIMCGRRRLGRRCQANHTQCNRLSSHIHPIYRSYY